MGLRILFVEKDVTTADLLLPSLERKGHQVAVVSTQRQAAGRMRSLRPDLLIIDIASFGLSGYKISDAVRSRLARVPTILLLEEGHDSAGSTADAFMTPPFTSRKLLYRVKEIAQDLTSREIQIGSMRFDPDTRTLYRKKQILYLRPKEAGLLMFFLKHAGKVVAREDILRQVWETDYVEDTRTLSVHIRWLREKIEDDPSNPRFLRTVRGVGYRFEVPETEIPPA
jgi:DNA-binding response OmpR family regulator